MGDGDRVRFRPGTSFPLHRHPQEQIVVMQRGEAQMTIGETVHRLAAGPWCVLAPDVDHGATAPPGGGELVAIVPRRDPADPYDLAGAEATFR